MNKTHKILIDVGLYNFPDNLEMLLIDAFDDKDFGKKHTARNTLVKMGKTIIPELHKLLVSKNYLIRTEAAKIVELIADKRSIKLLIGLLEDTEFEIRWIASEGLIKIGRRSIKPLLKAVCDSKSTMFLYKRVHQILNSLLYEDEKLKLSSLILSLDDYHLLGGTAPVEASRALNSNFKFSN